MTLTETIGGIVNETETQPDTPLEEPLPAEPEEDNGDDEEGEE